MKLKTKILAPALSTLVAAATVIPTAVVFTKANKVETKVNTKLTVNQDLFDVNNGRLVGFKSGVTQEQINAYVRQNGNTLALPTCKTIGASAFKNINLPFDVTIAIDVETREIGNYAFFGCDSVSAIKFMDGEQEVDVTKSQLETIGDHAFAFCSSLEILPVPKKLSSVGASAFYSCKALRTLNFSHFTRKEGAKNVADLEAIDNAMGTIGDYAFAGTYSPTSNTLIRIAISDQLPEGLTNSSFALRTKLSNLAGRIGATVDTAWYEGGKDWIEGVCGGVSFGIDIAIPQTYLKIDTGNGILQGITENAIPLLANAPYNALVVPTGIRQIETQLWKDAGRYIRDFDMSAATEMTTISAGFVGIDPEDNMSYAKRLENVYLPATIQTIDNNAFTLSPKLDWINLNDCPITSIGDYAFANTGVRCFDSDPLPKVEDPTIAHEVSMLYIDTDNLEHVGAGAFYNSKVEGIQFAGKGNTTFRAEGSPNTGVFAETNIWKLDFSKMIFSIDVKADTNELIIRDDSSASYLFKNLFMPQGWTGPTDTFTGAFANIVKKSASDPTAANSIIVPQVMINSGELTATVNKFLWFRSFQDVEDVVSGYTVVDQWKATSTEYGRTSFLEALGTMSHNADKLSQWTLTNPANQYKFIAQEGDPHIRAEQTPGVYPTAGVDFQFRYNLLDTEKSWAPDFERGKIVINGKLLTPEQTQTLVVNPSEYTITIPATLITGDVQVQLISRQITTYTLTKGTMTNVVVSEPLPGIQDVGQTVVHFEINKGYEFDPDATKIYNADSSTIDCWTFDAEGTNIVINGSLVHENVTIDIAAKVTVLKPLATVDKNFDQTAIPKDTINWTDYSDASPWTFDFKLTESGYTLDEEATTIVDAQGTEIKYDFVVNQKTLTVSIKGSELQKAASFGQEINFDMHSKQAVTPVKFKFYNSTADDHITLVTPDSDTEIEKGKDLVITITVDSELYKYDINKSFISILGKKVSVSPSQEGTVITLTIPGELVLGDVFVNFAVTAA